MQKLWFTKDGRDITEGINLRNSKANLGGWSTHEVWVEEFGGETMVEHKIGSIYCGQPIDMAEGYGFRIEECPDQEPG